MCKCANVKNEKLLDQVLGIKKLLGRIFYSSKNQV